MKLYKYMPGNRACEFFSLPLLRLANPNGLNDPFEFSLTKELSRNIETMHSKQGTREEGLISYVENFKSFGVISLSETYDNLLMWSHYADEHRGAVFELTIDGDNPNSLFVHAPPTPMPNQSTLERWIIENLEATRTKFLPSQSLTFEGTIYSPNLMSGCMKKSKGLHSITRKQT